MVYYKHQVIFHQVFAGPARKIVLQIAKLFSLGTFIRDDAGFSDRPQFRLMI